MVIEQDQRYDGIYRSLLYVRVIGWEKQSSSGIIADEEIKLTRYEDFDFKVGLGDPIHCPAELGHAAIVSQITRMNEYIACR